MRRGANRLNPAVPAACAPIASASPLGVVFFYSLLLAEMLLMTTATQAQVKTDTAIFAGGCFWCVEADFDALPGVITSTPGYTGGELANPTYEQVSSGTTGHVEAVEVQFNPSAVNYRTLVETFFRNIDPLDAHGQFCDTGSQYHSVIFYRSKDQQQTALAVKAAVEQQLGGKPVATLIAEAKPFYPAEDYHQKYYRKNPQRYKMYKYGCGREQRLHQIWGASESPKD
jgi:peptide-methionine (S)-S-oxide reductase